MSSGLAALRRLTSKRQPVERCELCAAPVAAQHPHLADPKDRRLLCVCEACAILFDNPAAAYRRVPRDARALDGFALSDVQWSALGIPIGLAFLFRSSASGAMAAVYPSPAGPTEAPVDESAWSEVAALDPALSKLRPDVEALLVNRIRGAREYYVAPIDACYRLSGIVRASWSGYTGGDEVWGKVGEFFRELRRHA